MRSIITGIYLLVLLMSLPALPAFSGGLGSEKLLWEANQLFLEYKDTEALEKFEALLASHPGHQEALYKSSILCGRIGSRFTDETSKNVYFQKALFHAQKALAIDSTQADANYVMALSLGNLCQTGTLKERIGFLVNIKHYVTQALVYNLNHAGAWHLLGRWSYKVANMSLAERAMGKVFMQTSFPSVTNEQSMEALAKAVELDPTNLLYYYDLARVQRDATLNRHCVETLQKALDQKMMTTEDLAISRKCKILLQEVLKVKAS